eukprot:TRINITY_DN2004_c0_g1_i4.p1 TRINITY_DN2004_c0_g1~~TRINITY_DN2004_c0_g1_i4.p1  ORF type:complete len:163 (+),score=17.39 TRINITY_DN2004_c0_g1_i4:128-616(+)
MLDTEGFQRIVYAKDAEEQEMWVNAIRSSVRGTNRFKSFVPPRKLINAQWFTNAHEYFEELVPSLLHAKRRIFIADWYFSPGLYMKRPIEKNMRLDRLLRNIAREGVKVYLLIWNAPNVGVSLHSKYVVDYMNTLHSNITALSHPGITPFAWSHHQKFGSCY